MKILFLIPSLRPGGAEKQLILLSKELAYLGNQVSIGYLNDGPLLSEIDKKNIKIKKIKIFSRKSPLSLFRIILFIAKENPDIVQTFLSYMDLLGGFSSFILRKPFILSERCNGPNEEDNKLIIFFKFLILKLSRSIICNSVPGRNFWKNKSPNSNVIYIPNIVEKTISKKFKKEFPSSNFKILLLSRFIERKNCLLSLKVFCEHQKTHPNTEYILVGEGETKKDCVSYVKKFSMNPNKFKFEGFRKNIETYFCESDIFVSLSKSEGTPNAALEAAAYKCPMFLSNISEHRNIFSSKEAFFVPLSNYIEIAKFLNKALNSSNLRGKKALKAYNSVVKNNNPRNIALKYLKSYSESIN